MAELLPVLGMVCRCEGPVEMPVSVGARVLVKTPTSIADALDVLERDGLIVVERDELGHALRARITCSGRSMSIERGVCDPRTCPPIRG